MSMPPVGVGYFVILEMGRVKLYPYTMQWLDV